MAPDGSAFLIKTNQTGPNVSEPDPYWLCWWHLPWKPVACLMCYEAVSLFVCLTVTTVISDFLFKRPGHVQVQILTVPGRIGLPECPQKRNSGVDL